MTVEVSDLLSFSPLLWWIRDSHGRYLIYCLCPERINVAIELFECGCLKCCFWLIQQR